MNFDNSPCVSAITKKTAVFLAVPETALLKRQHRKKSHERNQSQVEDHSVTFLTVSSHSSAVHASSALQACSMRVYVLLLE